MVTAQWPVIETQPQSLVLLFNLSEDTHWGPSFSFLPLSLSLLLLHLYTYRVVFPLHHSFLLPDSKSVLMKIRWISYSPKELCRHWSSRLSCQRRVGQRDSEGPILQIEALTPSLKEMQATSDITKQRSNTKKKGKHKYLVQSYYSHCRKHVSYRAISLIRVVNSISHHLWALQTLISLLGILNRIKHSLALKNPSVVGEVKTSMLWL